MGDAELVQKVLEMIDLPNLTVDGQSFVVVGSRRIIVVESIGHRSVLFCEQQIAANDQAGPSFSSLTMNCNNGLLQEVVFDDLQLLLGEMVSVIVTSQTIDDVALLLEHSLKKQENIQADIEECSHRANVMILETIFAVSKLGNIRLGILLVGLKTQVVYFDTDTMSALKKLDEVLTIVSDGGLNATSWETARYYVVRDISKIKIVPTTDKSLFLLRNQGPDNIKRIHGITILLLLLIFDSVLLFQLVLGVQRHIGSNNLFPIIQFYQRIIGCGFSHLVKPDRHNNLFRVEAANFAVFSMPLLFFLFLELFL